MPLLQLLMILIVVGVLLWLVNNFIPMQGSIKSILNAIVVIGVVLWLLAYVWPSMGSGLMGFMPMKLLLVSTLWGLGEVILAALAGAAVYAEAP